MVYDFLYDTGVPFLPAIPFSTFSLDGDSNRLHGMWRLKIDMPKNMPLWPAKFSIQPNTVLSLHTGVYWTGSGLHVSEDLYDKIDFNSVNLDTVPKDIHVAAVDIFIAMKATGKLPFPNFESFIQKFPLFLAQVAIIHDYVKMYVNNSWNTPHEYAPQQVNFTAKVTMAEHLGYDIEGHVPSYETLLRRKTHMSAEQRAIFLERIGVYAAAGYNTAHYLVKYTAFSQVPANFANTNIHLPHYSLRYVLIHALAAFTALRPPEGRGRSNVISSGAKDLLLGETNKGFFPKGQTFVLIPPQSWIMMAMDDLGKMSPQGIYEWPRSVIGEDSMDVVPNTLFQSQYLSVSALDMTEIAKILLKYQPLKVQNCAPLGWILNENIEIIRDSSALVEKVANRLPNFITEIMHVVIDENELPVSPRMQTTDPGPVTGYQVMTVQINRPMDGILDTQPLAGSANPNSEDFVTYGMAFRGLEAYRSEIVKDGVNSTDVMRKIFVSMYKEKMGIE